MSREQNILEMDIEKSIDYINIFLIFPQKIGFFEKKFDDKFILPQQSLTFGLKFHLFTNLWPHLI